MTASRLSWVRVGDRYPDLAGELNHFIALDNETEVGVVKLVALGPDEGQWMWSMLLTQEGPAFKQLTNGTCETRLQAVRELHACWWAFRAYYGIEDEA